MTMPAVMPTIEISGSAIPIAVICRSKVTTERASIRRLDSARHILELREVERLLPFETALGEHLKHRFDALGVIQAAERDEDHSREALQVGGEHPGAAFGAEVSV